MTCIMFMHSVLIHVNMNAHAVYVQFATYEKLKEYFSLNEKSNDQVCRRDQRVVRVH